MKEEKRFSNLLVNLTKFEDSESSEIDDNNNDFELKKYEKFKPKNKIKNDNTLKRTEDQVKNLLSCFIKNIEEENKIDLIYDGRKNKRNKFKGIINKKMPSKSISLNLMKKKISKDNIFNNIKRKSKFKSNSNIIKINNISEGNNNNIRLNDNKLNTSKYLNLNYNYKKKFENKEIINGFFHIRNSLGSKNFSNNKKVQNKENKLISNDNRISYPNNANPKSLIKKHKSVNQNNIYLNFKKDFIIKKSSLNNHKEIQRIINNSIKDIPKESNNDSILSDFSNSNLNKNSLDRDRIFRGHQTYKVDDNNINKRKSSKLNKFNQLNKKPFIHLTELSNKNIDGKSHLNGKIFFLRNSYKSNMNYNRRTTEENFNDNNIFSSKRKYFNLEPNFKSVREQLKKSIIIRPEELDISLNEEEENNKFIRKQINEIITLKNENKSNGNLLKIDSKENISNNNLDCILVENKSYEAKNDMKKINTNNSYKTHSHSNIDDSNVLNNDNLKRENVEYYEKYRFLIHKQCIYDSIDDEEFEDEEEINNYYIEPNSFFSIIFDLVIFSMSIISLIEVPFYLAMNHNFCKRNKITFLSLVNIFIEYLYIIDIFISFFRAFYNSDERLIVKKKIIAKKYITSWFLFDLLASIPFYTINKLKEPICNEKELSSHYYNIILNNLDYLFLNNRLFKIFKIFHSNEVWKIILNNINVYSWNKLRIIVYLFLLYISINYSACMYIFISRNSYPNWIYATKLESKEFINIYICSIYIILMAITTVGYGDIPCYSSKEKFFQILILNIGIMAYSTAVSFFSNYIKKINERSVDFEKRVSILDEIKINYPNLSDQLYERILRYLKFKNFHEKKLKNVIFDCLPVGLKNNLISEMYKPIIKNFIFFKNFQNLDFIVRVILAFKPIMAYKKDILVNEGDMVKDIMFVSKGILSVELPINLSDQQENINKYLKSSLFTKEKGPNIQKIGNSTIIPANSIHNNYDKFLNKRKSYYDLSSFLSSTNLFKYSPTFNKILPKIKKENEKKVEEKKNIVYIKIVRIRQNEHFGDVLMFLDQRSPLRVRVKSKKCELFFLKKIDAIKISTSYQNIWRRINKKSVYNFEQMKKNIKKMVEIYCCSKIKNDKEISDAFPDKKDNIKSKNDSYNFNLIKNKGNILKRSKSLILRKINYYKLLKNIKTEVYLNSNIFHKKNKNKCHSSKKLIRKYILNSIYTPSKKTINSINSSLYSSSNNKFKYKNNKNNNKNKFVQINDNENHFAENRLTEILNDNYKYYKGIKEINNNNKKISIISEKQGKEITIDKFGCSNSNKLMKDVKLNPSKNSGKIASKYKNKNINNYIDLIDNRQEEESKSSSFEHNINKEIYSEEEIHINNGDNLLNKKINFDIVNINKELDIKRRESKNNKLKILLNISEDYFENKNKNINISKESNKNENVYKRSNSFMKENSILDNMDLQFKSYRKKNNKKEDTSQNHCKIKKKCWDSKILQINNNSFQLNSLYDNLNIIGGKILMNNRNLQDNLKRYLLEQIMELSKSNINKIELKKLKKTNSFEKPFNFKEKNTSLSTIELNKNSSKSIIYDKNKKRNKNFNNDSIKKIKTSKIINIPSLLYKNEKQKKKSETNIFQSGIIDESIETLFNNKFIKENNVNQKGLIYQNMNILNNINNINYYNNSTGDLPKQLNTNRKNSAIISLFSKPKKKDNNLLSKINLNIQKTNQNLNNPEQFYSNYFNSILKGEIIGRNFTNKNFYSPNMADKFRKNVHKEKNKKNK